MSFWDKDGEEVGIEYNIENVHHHTRTDCVEKDIPICGLGIGMVRARRRIFAINAGGAGLSQCPRMPSTPATTVARV